MKSTTIYGIVAVTGIGMIPVVAESIIFGKDHVLTELDQEFQAVYEACVTTLRQVGELSNENKENGIIKGKASGCSINIKLTKTKQGKTQITLSARKLLLPKQKIADGILHEITQNLKN